MFIRDMRAMGGWTIYPETADFDILLVRDATGHQLGVEAKLQLNAKVASQIIPGGYMGCEIYRPGPDFRAVIVPCITESNAGIAEMLRILGVQVFAPENYGHLKFRLGRYGETDARPFDSTSGSLMEWDLAWHDWNPPRRCELPSIVPDVRAGVPAPIRLTPWKIGALRVLADLELDGFVTAKSVREHNVDARRFCASDGWLVQLGDGRWGRGTVPAFDQQHPEAYAQVLAEAKARRAVARSAA
nr:hypothetical protein [Dyella sp. SG562]